MAKYRATFAMGAIALLILTSCQAEGERVENSAQVEQASSALVADISMLDNEVIMLPDISSQLQLHHGTGEFEITPGSSKGRVTLIEGTQNIWQSPDRTDLITAMAINNGGSGTFFYIAIYSKKDGSLILDDSAFLGDRIKILSVGTGELVHDKHADYRITIQTLERAENEPMASKPAIPTTRIFYVTKGKLEAVSPAKNDT